MSVYEMHENAIDHLDISNVDSTIIRSTGRAAHRFSFLCCGFWWDPCCSSF